MASKIMVEWIEGRAAGKRLYVTRNSIKEGTVAPGKTASVIWGKSRLRIVIVIIYHVRIRIRTYVYANFRTCSFPQLLSQKPSDSCVANCRRWHCPTAEKCKNRQVSFDLYRIGTIVSKICQMPQFEQSTKYSSHQNVQPYGIQYTIHVLVYHLRYCLQLIYHS